MSDTDGGRRIPLWTIGGGILFVVLLGNTIATGTSPTLPYVAFAAAVLTLAVVMIYLSIKKIALGSIRFVMRRRETKRRN